MNTASLQGDFEKNLLQYQIDRVVLGRQLRPLDAPWTLMDNMPFLLRFHGRAWTKHGRTWMKQHGRITKISMNTIIYMDMDELFPDF